MNLVVYTLPSSVESLTPKLQILESSKWGSCFWNALVLPNWILVQRTREKPGG